MMTTKRLYLCLLGLTLMGGLEARAQHVSLGPLHSADDPREDWLLPGDTVYQDGKTVVYGGKPMKNPNYAGKQGVPASTNLASKETETLPSLEYGESPALPLGYGWGLHKGLNLSVGLSVFATFGKHAPHWGGFTQNINATYLTPLTKDNRLWMALGTYVNNINYGGDNLRDGGVYGMLGYRIDEHWEAFVYGQVSVANNYGSIYNRYAGYGPYGYGRWGYGMYPGAWGMGVMPGGYGMGAAGANVLGAGVKYTNKNFSFGISVEGNWYNNSNTPAYYKQYDYPVPEAGKK